MYGVDGRLQVEKVGLIVHQLAACCCDPAVGHTVIVGEDMLHLIVKRCHQVIAYLGTELLLLLHKNVFVLSLLLF